MILRKIVLLVVVDILKMDFEDDPLVGQISRRETEETFGLIICALFHQPKPLSFRDFYHQFIDQLRTNLTADEQQSIYLYPIDYLHITICTLYSFKDAPPSSPDRCLQYWKECFNQLKQTSNNRSIVLTFDSIKLSKAAGYFLFQDEAQAFGKLRQSIREICQPEQGQPDLLIPGIVHTSFLRFIKKPNDAKIFEEKFHRICQEVLVKAKEIIFNIDEICLALESRAYMHIPCDKDHILDIMKC